MGFMLPPTDGRHLCVLTPHCEHPVPNTTETKSIILRNSNSMACFFISTQRAYRSYAARTLSVRMKKKAIAVRCRWRRVYLGLKRLPRPEDAIKIQRILRRYDKKIVAGTVLATGLLNSEYSAGHLIRASATTEVHMVYLFLAEEFSERRGRLNPKTSERDHFVFVQNVQFCVLPGTLPHGFDHSGCTIGF